MFDVLKTLLTYKVPTKEEIQKINSYTMVRWLSGNKYTVIPANLININYNIPIENQYQFFDDVFDLMKIKKNIKFIKYNSDSNSNASKETKKSKIIQNISMYYKINLKEAEKYYSLMSSKEHKRFKDMYKEGKI